MGPEVLSISFLPGPQVGVLAPEPTPTGKLLTGQVGYVILGIKTTKAARVGDTLHAAKKPVLPLPGFRPAKSMVFAGVRLSNVFLTTF